MAPPVDQWINGCQNRTSSIDFVSLPLTHAHTRVSYCILQQPTLLRYISRVWKVRRMSIITVEICPKHTSNVEWIGNLCRKKTLMRWGIQMMQKLKVLTNMISQGRGRDLQRESISKNQWNGGSREDDHNDNDNGRENKLWTYYRYPHRLYLVEWSQLSPSQTRFLCKLIWTDGSTVPQYYYVY